ncbi:MAG TPA: phage tail tape measure protein, partial [Planctomycetaceae bacterium]|nr:phage tail tape measure protein [Planctomycetaceae bacterium]
DLAKVSAGFKGLLTPEEQISTFGTMTNVMQGAEAATAMKGVVKNLSIIGGKKDAQPYLRMMGVNPEDIDLAADKNGQNKENFDTVLGRLQEGLARIPESKRAEALAKIVEGDNIAPLQFLMANRDKLKENIAKQSDVAGFENDVRTGQSGRGAAARRLKLKEEIQLAEQADDSELKLIALRTVMRDQGESEARIGLAEKGFNLARNFGADSDQALWFAAPGGEQGAVQKDFVRDEVARAQDPVAFLQQQQALARQMLEESRKTNRLLEENGKKPPVKVIPKDNRQPPAPVPAAALGGPQ